MAQQVGEVVYLKKLTANFAVYDGADMIVYVRRSALAKNAPDVLVAHVRTPRQDDLGPSEDGPGDS